MGEASKRKKRFTKHEKEVVLIPDKIVGQLLGFRGFKIKNIQEYCSARIDISYPGDVVEDNKRMISISGTKASIKDAKERLFNALLEAGIEYEPLRPVTEKEPKEMNKNSERWQFERNMSENDKQGAGIQKELKDLSKEFEIQVRNANEDIEELREIRDNLTKERDDFKKRFEESKANEKTMILNRSIEMARPA